MLTRETAINTIKRFIIACNQKDIQFKNVILFGSAANGTANDYSDIDVALVSDQFSGNPFSDWHLFSPINIKFTEIEPHPFLSQYFEESDPFIEEIKRAGIEIV